MLILLNLGAAASNNQALSLPLDSISAAVAQAVSHGQALAVVLDGVAAVLTQASMHGQSFAVALDGVAIVAGQVSSHPQAVAASLDGVSVAIAQVLANVAPAQSLSVPLGDVTIELTQASSAVPDPQVQWLGGGSSNRREKGSYWDRLLSPPMQDAAARATDPLEDQPSAPTRQPADPLAMARSLSVHQSATTASQQTMRRSVQAAMRAAQMQALADLHQALITRQAEHERLLMDDEDDALCALLLAY